MVGHDHKEHEIGVFDGSVASADGGQDLLVVVVLNALREGVQQILLVVGCLVVYGANVCVFNLNVEALV